MTGTGFNETDWIARLAAALETVVERATPCGFPLPADAPRRGRIDDFRAYQHRQYRALAAQAKRNPEAAKLFEDSRLLLDSEPAEASAIIREHPLLRPGLIGDGDAVGFCVLNRWASVGLNSLAGGLAKLSVKEGGEYSAGILHRYLSAGAQGKIPAHEITVIHGLDLDRELDLGAGARLAPYSQVKTAFELPDEDSYEFSFDRPDTARRQADLKPAVLIRKLRYGPGIHADSGELVLPVRASYVFPSEYEIGMEEWWDDRRLLADVLSVSARVPLLCRSRYVRVEDWVAEIDPNIGFGTQQRSGHVSDEWPKGQKFTRQAADEFATLGRGWRAHVKTRSAVNVAIRRLAGSFSRPGGRFGVEDRIIDVAIALEALCGAGKSHKVAQRAASLLGRDDAERLSIYDAVKAFHKTRSRIVHVDDAVASIEQLQTVLCTGQRLACDTLKSMFARPEPIRWADVVAPIETVRRRVAAQSTANRKRSSGG